MRLLVVCTANIARSPLFEALLDDALGDGVACASAGTRARDGYPAAEYSQVLAVDRGLDLSEHRSQRVTPDLIAGTDLVLTMSEHQRDACSPLAARSAGHVFTVREFVRLLDAVDDPAEGDTVADRLLWLRDQAHLARPRATPPRGPEDVADPIRSPWPEWEDMGRTFDHLVAVVTGRL